MIALRVNSSARERFIKPRKIKPYDGESQSLQSFLTAIELQMENDGITESERKVRYVGNYFTGRAWYWFEPILRLRILSSYNEMKKAMRQVFGDVDERTVSAQKLQNLRQTRSVLEYITDFQMISSNLEWDEDALMDKFKGGLKQHILSLLIYFPNKPRKSCLKELKELMQKVLTRRIGNTSTTERFTGRTTPVTILREIRMEMSR